MFGSPSLWDFTLTWLIEQHRAKDCILVSRRIKTTFTDPLLSTRCQKWPSKKISWFGKTCHVLNGNCYWICFSGVSFNRKLRKLKNDEKDFSLFNDVHKDEDEEGVWVVEHGWIIRAYFFRFRGMELIQGRFNYKTEMNLNRTKEIRIISHLFYPLFLEFTSSSECLLQCLSDFISLCINIPVFVNCCCSHKVLAKNIEQFNFKGLMITVFLLHIFWCDVWSPCTSGCIPGLVNQRFIKLESCWVRLSPEGRSWRQSLELPCVALYRKVVGI